MRAGVGGFYRVIGCGETEGADVRRVGVRRQGFLRGEVRRVTRHPMAKVVSYPSRHTVVPPMGWRLGSRAYGESAEIEAPPTARPPLGNTKVLGKGRLPNTPMIVKARYVSRKVEIKIKEAGGVVDLVA